MNPSGFFVIHIDEPGPQLASRGESRAGEETPGSGYNVRLGWVEGSPLITDLGSVGEVLVNSTPIEPNMPMIIQVGDTITIGNAHLTWQVRAEPRKPAREPVLAEAAAELPSQPPPPPPAPVYSVLVKTDQWTKEFPVAGKVVRVGRASDNDIHIDDDRVSRYHAQIVQHAEGYEIVDLGSVNGLTFQGARIARHLIADGDVVWLARSVSLTCQVTRPELEKEVLPIQPSEPPRVRPMDATIVVPGRKAEPAIAETPDRTVVVPREAVKPSEPVPSAPADRVAEPPGVPEADKTIVRRPAKAPAPDETVIVPEKPAQPPEPATAEEAIPPAEQPPDATVVVPKPAAPPADKTVVVPRQEPRPPAPETPAARPGQFAGETALIDMAQVLQEDMQFDAVSSTIIRDTKIPHLVLHLPKRTWEAQFTKERMTIGRGEDNDIPIPDPSISRHHASIERRGNDYVIREAHSRNGIWLRDQRVEEHTLQDGDILSLGRAKLVYKAGFTADDLTLIKPPRIDGKPTRRPVLFVPGLLGSELWLGGECLWPNPRLLISNPEVYSLPGDPRIEARGIVSDVVIVPNIIKQEQYSRLGDYLEIGLGYTRDKDFLEFAYDWRQDIRLASQRLAETVELWQPGAPITVIAHSLGTLVTRYYVEKLGGKRFVERVILMGGPHYGAPKGLSVILIGPGMLPLGMGAERMRQVLATFPSAYQILPIYPCVTDQDGNQIDVLKDDTWLPENQRPYLRAARSFRRELGFRSSVPAVSIFGYGLKTILRVQIHRRPGGQWQKVDFIEDTAGDVSVPSGSAVLKGSEIHPVFQEHGSLYVDDDVKMRLKVELTRSTTWQRRKRR